MMEVKTKIEILRSIDLSYGLVNLFKIDAVPAKVIFHKDVFDKYDSLLIQGYEESRAKVLTAKFFKVNIRLVQRVVKEMK